MFICAKERRVLERWTLYSQRAFGGKFVGLHCRKRVSTVIHCLSSPLSLLTRASYRSNYPRTTREKRRLKENMSTIGNHAVFSPARASKLTFNLDSLSLVMTPSYVSVAILFTIHSAAGIQFPKIENFTFVPLVSTNVTTLYNVSCHECLCRAYSNASVAVNCFLFNKTCQLFKSFPIRYRIQPTSNARVYFPGGSLPSPSECCMPNTTLLIQKLKNATTKSYSLSNPRCLVIDDHGYLVTVQENGPNLSRFYPYNLTLIDTKTFSGYTMSNIAYHQGAYFLSTQTNTILIVNSSTLLLINTITPSGTQGIRDMIFLKDGQTMVFVSADNNKLFYLNRSSSSPRNYAYTRSVSTSYLTPHGLWYVSDTLFYASSWTTKNVYKYTTVNNWVTWNETLFIDTQGLASNRWGTHVMIDDCQRFWFSTANNGMLIYNSQGQLEGNFTSVWNGTFDAIFLDNYVLLLSDRNLNKIARLDPQIQC